MNKENILEYIRSNKKELKLFPYMETFPQIHESVYLASGSKIIGDVIIEENSSIWYNTVIRGDVNFIKIGFRTNVQDCSMLHVTNKRFPLIIGNKVTIGHSVTLHGCTIMNESLIGMGAIVLDGAVVENQSMVAAGSLVKQGFIVPSGKLVAGVPAKITRDLTKEEIQDIDAAANRYVDYTKATIESLVKYNYPVEW